MPPADVQSVPAHPLEHAVNVAEYLKQQLEQSPKTQAQIADEIGFANPNILTMMKAGQCKLPMTKIGKLADALGIDKRQLLRRVLLEYSPELLAVIEEVLGQPLTALPA